MILALDIARATGWAVGVDQPFLFGTHKLKSKTDNGWGDLACEFDAWLEEMISEHIPKFIVYEAPVIVHMHAAKMLTGLAWQLEYRATCERIPTQPVGNTQAKKHFAGRAYNKKEKPYPGIVECHRRGFMASTTDEADAIALWFFAKEKSDV